MFDFVSFDGTRISYQDEGDGPAVILIHGLTVDGATNFGTADRMVAMGERARAAVPEEMQAMIPPPPDLPSEGRRGLAAALRAAGARVVIPDMRGHGASGKPHDVAAYSDSAMARDIVALLDHLALDHADVLGYSMGAVVVTHLLALGEPRIRSAVLAGIGQYILTGETLALPEGMPGMDGLSGRVGFDAYSASQAQMLERSADGSGPTSLYEITVPELDPRAVAAVLRGAMSQFTPAEALRDVTAPVLVINGTADFANQEIDALVDAFPQARRATCDGDHLSAPFYPSFQEAVIGFLRTQWRHLPARAI